VYRFFVLFQQLLVVDVDKNRLVKSVGDESTILPRKVRKCLQTALSLVTELTEPGDPARNVLISETFISVFVDLCGHYKNHIVPGTDGKKVFQVRSTRHLTGFRNLYIFLLPSTKLTLDVENKQQGII
jgi:hypothetical protein